MKLLLILLIVFSINIFAETVVGIGKVEPNYNNLPDAKKSAKTDAIKKYQIKKYNKYAECLKDEFKVDEEKYEALLMHEKSVKLTPQNLILEATFEVHEKYNLDNYFNKKCKDKISHEETVASVKETLSHFHMGIGAMGWAGTYGGEIFFGYERDFFAIYGTYSYQKLLAMTKIENKEVDLGYSHNIAIEGTFFWKKIVGFLVGYEQIIKYNNSFDSTDATSAMVWGISSKPNNSKWDIALIFKEYNDENDIRDRALSGGIRVRYNFF